MSDWHFFTTGEKITLVLGFFFIGIALIGATGLVLTSISQMLTGQP